MNRKILREFTHKAENFLNLENNTYKQWVFRYTFLELEKDLGSKGDITTKSIFPINEASNAPVNAKVIANGDGIFAGKEEVNYFLVRGDSKFRPGIRGEFKLEFPFEDGQEFKKGDVILKISAGIHDLLAVERTLVNLLMRMSAVATFTRKIVEIVRDYDVLVTPTRKSLWGLIDKKAVVIGGGGTHRLGLYDAVLIKDTHLDLVGRDLEKVLINVIEANLGGRFIELEVENKEESLKAAEIFDKFFADKLRTVVVLLMDNMTAVEVKEAVKEIKNKGFYDKLLFEASGGITEETVLDYARTGVDIISMGCLTAGVKGIDMSMKIGI